MTTSEIHQRQIILSQIRAEQSLTILDGLDLEIKPATAITIARDAHGVALVRHPALGTFRGASVRDALAQMLQALACPPTRRTGAGPGPVTVHDLELATDAKCGTLRAMKVIP